MRGRGEADIRASSVGVGLRVGRGAETRIGRFEPGRESLVSQGSQPRGKGGVAGGEQGLELAPCVRPHAFGLGLPVEGVIHLAERRLQPALVPESPLPVRSERRALQ